MISQNIRIKDLPKSMQQSIFNEVYQYAKVWGYSERECTEQALHAMELTLFDVSERVDIRKYI